MLGAKRRVGLPPACRARQSCISLIVVHFLCLVRSSILGGFSNLLFLVCRSSLMCSRSVSVVTLYVVGFFYVALGKGNFVDFFEKVQCDPKNPAVQMMSKILASF